MTGNLEAWFIDHDKAQIGHALWQAFGNTTGDGKQLGWTKVNPADVGTDEDIANAIVNERAWVAVVGKSYSPHFSPALTRARSLSLSWCFSASSISSRKRR